ncbi:MAG: zinc ribbon domain-containing protein [Acidobacteria bacterium]|nr:zinc ribbon domain-containing protein [Acidobacteriota bacterium]
MYCPSCGTENQDGVKFCRLCGVNLSLVPQALTGQLPQEPSTRRSRRDRHHQPSMESAIRNLFMGIGFIFVSLAIMRFVPAGRIWWFWMLIPAFGMLGKGFSEYFAVKNNQEKFPQPVNRPVIAPPPPSVDSRPRNTGEMLQPPASVTESTTKLFDPPAEK